MLSAPVIKIVGGLLVSAVLFANASLTQINKKISQRAIIQQNEIQQEVDELINDYLDFESDYIDMWIEENDVTEELTEDDLIDIKKESIDSYINNEKYDDGNIHIYQQELNYIKKQLPQPAIDFIDRADTYKIDRGQNEAQRIIWFYLNYKNGDKFDWLKR